MVPLLVRAYDLVYRLGEEEPSLPVPTHRNTTILAEELRLAIAAEPLVNSAEVTISLCLSASARGSAFVYTEVYQAANNALYEAKEAGRNRVRQRMSCGA